MVWLDGDKARPVRESPFCHWLPSAFLGVAVEPGTVDDGGSYVLPCFETKLNVGQRMAPDIEGNHICNQLISSTTTDFFAVFKTTGPVVDGNVPVQRI